MPPFFSNREFTLCTRQHVIKATANYVDLKIKKKLFDLNTKIVTIGSSVQWNYVTRNQWTSLTESWNAVTDLHKIVRGGKATRQTSGLIPICRNSSRKVET
jgi:hypothetical protein